MKKKKISKKPKLLPFNKWLRTLKGPFASVAGIVANSKGEVLLIKRAIKPFKAYWVLPGGHIELYENAEKAVKREVKEETGVRVNGLKFFTYSEEIYPKIKWHAVCLAFSAKTKDRPKKNDFEASEIRFFSKKQVAKLKLGFGHKKILQDFFREIWH